MTTTHLILAVAYLLGAAFARGYFVTAYTDWNAWGAAVLWPLVLPLHIAGRLGGRVGSRL